MILLLNEWLSTYYQIIWVVQYYRLINCFHLLIILPYFVINLVYCLCSRAEKQSNKIRRYSFVARRCRRSLATASSTSRLDFAAVVHIWHIVENIRQQLHCRNRACIDQMPYRTYQRHKLASIDAFAAPNGAFARVYATRLHTSTFYAYYFKYCRCRCK